MKNKINLIKQNHPYIDIDIIDNTEIIELQKTKSNDNTIVVESGNKSIYLHSKYDPQKEAVNQVENLKINDHDITVILGIGLGYHLIELLKKYPDNRFIVIDLNNSVLNTFFHYVSDSVILNKNVVYLTEKATGLLDQALSYFIYLEKDKELKIQIFKHPASFNLYKEKYVEVEKNVYEISTKHYSNILTEKKQQDLWQRNIKINTKYVEDSGKMIELKGKYQNRPMIIVCAGYSLEKNTDFILKQKEAKIVSVDTCLRYLIRNNIFPDYVLSLDAGYENFGDFKYLKINDSVKLIYDMVSFTKIPSLFKKRYVTYTLKMVKDFFTNKWIEYYDDNLKPVFEKYGDFGGLQSGGSVATNAFDFALYTGANPIYFVGLDLNYCNYKTHCRGTYKESYLVKRMNKFYNYETLNFITVVTRKNLVKTEGNNIYHYDFILRKYRQWFDVAFNMIKDREIKVIK